MILSKKQRIKLFLESWDEVHAALMKGAQRKAEVYGDEAGKFVDTILDITEVGDSVIVEMKGEDTWEYGGNETYYYTFDARWAYDDEFVEAKRKEVKDKRRRQEEIHQSVQAEFEE